MPAVNQNNRETPILNVSLLRNGSSDIDVDIRDMVTAFKYTDSDKRTDKCTFTVRNDDLSNFDKPLWKKGARLRVQWGYLGAMSPARIVVIESVKGFSTLSVEAHGVDMLMNKTKKPRVFRNITRSGVANAIAFEWGFGEENRFIQPTTQIFPQVSQAGLTDAKLLAKLARKESFVFYVDFDGFHWHERDVKQAPARRYIYGASAQISEMVLGEPSIENDVTVPRYKGIRRKGIDKETGEPFDEVASNVDTERDGLAPILDNSEDVSVADLDLSTMEQELSGLGVEGDELVEGGDSGGWMTALINASKQKVSSGLAAAKYEIEKAQQNGGASYNPEEVLYSDPDGVDFTDPDASANYSVVEQVDPRDGTTSQILVGAGSEGYVPIDESPSSAATAEEAKTDADSKYKRAQGVAVRLKFDVYGDPHLLAKTVIRFDAWGGGKMSKRISGLYYVSEVEHDIARGNYVCRVECRTDGGGSGSGAKTKSGSNANLNKDEGAANNGADPVGEIRALEEIDPETEETRLIWTDSRGRPWTSLEVQTTDEGNLSPA